MNAVKASPTPRPADTIFVVDDEPVLLDLAEAILQSHGFRVQTFRDPLKALAEFSTAKPSVVITDYAMGETNGLDLLRACRRLNPEQRVMLVSGTVDEQIFSADAVKPDCFLPKPYLVDDFVRTVRSLAQA